MGLEVSRAKLKLRLLIGNAFDQGEESETLKMIDEWWAFYKQWEEKDTFMAAFEQGRLTVRQGPESQKYGEYLGNASGAGFAARHENVEKQKYPDERYRVGIDSLKERLNPDNFMMDHGERIKYKKGLHDLSGSLLTTKVKKITDQVRWKWTGGKLDNWITIFMPLAKPEDMALFALLNAMAKEARVARRDIYDKVVYIRNRMTRLKLADSVDIGAGLHDVATGKPTEKDYKPKFKYGVKSALDSKGKLTGDDLERSRKALDYTSILPTEITEKNTNEIVIAYREHAGVRFPLFTQYHTEKEAYVCLKDDPASKYIVHGEIPDDWIKTVEV